ncbi:hypothetical protein CRUP_032979 [Coryphaenoides rupestris]|nr:hypothetical protein CRUP_032979 [Coryphaenoides rupestris]
MANYATGAPSRAEQEALLWQEQDERQLGPYRPAGHGEEQSSPCGRTDGRTDRVGEEDNRRLESKVKSDPSCHPLSGECSCSSGWTGLYCNESCPSGYYGDSCGSACDCAHGTECHSVTGSCICPTGLMPGAHWHWPVTWSQRPPLRQEQSRLQLTPYLPCGQGWAQTEPCGGENNKRGTGGANLRHFTFTSLHFTSLSLHLIDSPGGAGAQLKLQKAPVLGHRCSHWSPWLPKGHRSPQLGPKPATKPTTNPPANEQPRATKPTTDRRPNRRAVINGNGNRNIMKAVPGGGGSQRVRVCQTCPAAAVFTNVFTAILIATWPAFVRGRLCPPAPPPHPQRPLRL